MEVLDVISRSVEETLRTGESFGRSLSAGSVVGLMGALGAGKTHFVKGVARSRGVNPEHVSSPTFTIAHLYRGDVDIHHLDCYRLEDEEELIRTGMHEEIGGEGICLIEWPQRIEGLLPAETILVSIEHGDSGSRRIRVFPPSSNE